MNELQSSWRGIIVAAGQSRRMGSLKPLLPFGDGTVLERVIEIARKGTIESLVVVLGHQAAEVAAILPSDVDVRCVTNPDYAAGGMLSSVCCGLRAVLPERPSVVAILLGDQPTLTPEVIRALRLAWEDDGRITDAFYVPSYKGRKGHPLCIAADLIPHVLEYSGTDGLRGLMRSMPDRLRTVLVTEPGVLMDMDTPDAYRDALRWYETRHTVPDSA